MGMWNQFVPEISVIGGNKLTKADQAWQTYLAVEIHRSSGSPTWPQGTHIVLTKAVPQFRQGFLAICSPYDQLCNHGVIMHWNLISWNWKTTVTAPSQNSKWWSMARKTFCWGFMLISHLIFRSSWMIDIITTVLFMRNWGSQRFKNLPQVWGEYGHPRAPGPKTDPMTHRLAFPVLSSSEPSFPFSFWKSSQTASTLSCHNHFCP